MKIMFTTLEIAKIVEMGEKNVQMLLIQRKYARKVVKWK